MQYVSVKPISVRVFSKELYIEPALESGDTGTCWMSNVGVVFEGKTVGAKLARGINKVPDGSDAAEDIQPLNV
jgi:hypothetical protein